jgi:hypothetical protein
MCHNGCTVVCYTESLFVCERVVPRVAGFAALYTCAGRSTLGAAAADKLTGDHQLVKAMHNTLDTLTADHPDFDTQLRSRWGRAYAAAKHYFEYCVGSASSSSTAA